MLSPVNAFTKSVSSVKMSSELSDVSIDLSGPDPPPKDGYLLLLDISPFALLPHSCILSQSKVCWVSVTNKALSIVSIKMVPALFPKFLVECALITLEIVAGGRLMQKAS